MSREIDVKALVSHLVRGDGANKCRICMGDTSEGQVFLEDTVMMDGERSVTLADLLELITGIEVDLAPSLPSMACNACVASAKLAVPFIQLCSASQQKWDEVTEYLYEMDVSDVKERAYVFIDDDITMINKSRKRMKASSTNHRLGRIPLGQLKCPKCGKKSPSVYELNKHIKDIRMKMCIYCNRIIPTDSFENHVRVVHQATVFLCKACNRYFRSQKNFKKHKHFCSSTKSRNVGNHVCFECNKRFPSQFNLNAHCSYKHKERICRGCDIRFTSLQCYAYHSKRCTNSSKAEKYICDYCSREYRFKDALRHHIRYSHIVGWQHQCDQCGKTFCNAAHLREHDNTHNRVEDRYVCSICDAKYSTRRGYERHHKKHFDENGELREYTPLRKPRKRKMYGCIVCDLAFNSKRSLNSHLKSQHETVGWDQ
ncbi:zinc finger protein 700-like isoform X4 [Ostrinia furnacalis]|uniref:zinc finger protein 700-like isoform X4 n=1 Tax=Ostrinia furnacalis TaxID=93504 RepID=UPI00103CDF20|nr:zinc finger protein 700-like isoform X4 [Ostrinia furnacalis]